MEGTTCDLRNAGRTLYLARFPIDLQVCMCPKLSAPPQMTQAMHDQAQSMLYDVDRPTSSEKNPHGSPHVQTCKQVDARVVMVQSQALVHACSPMVIDRVTARTHLPFVCERNRVHAASRHLRHSDALQAAAIQSACSTASGCCPMRLLITLST